MNLQDPAHMEAVFDSLERSEFRQRFVLRRDELRTLRTRGLPTILNHAATLIEERLAPANPVKDGMQTPMKGHPVFIAQHATATCCRRCLLSWHQIPSGRALLTEEKDYILAVIKRWLGAELEKNREPDDPAQLSLL